MSQIWGQISQLKRKSTTLQLVSYMLSQCHSQWPTMTMITVTRDSSFSTNKYDPALLLAEEQHIWEAFSVRGYKKQIIWTLLRQRGPPEESQQYKKGKEISRKLNPYM